MPNPTAAMLVIGDEILSGRTRDANLHHLSQQFFSAGIDLKHARIVSDDHHDIVSSLNALRAAHDIVITSGGIGPTHDDITADAVAAAFGVAITIRADAREILETRYQALGTELNAARLRMARIPDTARLIANPVSGAPGFQIGNVFVMAGVPSVFQAMLAEVMPELGGGTPMLSETLRVNLPEGDIAEPLAQIAQANPTISLGSYPFHEAGRYGADIVLRGHDPDAIAKAKRGLGMAFQGAIAKDD